MDQFLVWKLFDRVLAPFQQSYVELAAFLGLCVLATAALVSRRRRQTLRFLIQLASIVIFFFVVSSCLGVFGLIRNGFYGLQLLSQQDDLGAFFWLSMTVVAVAAAFVGGAVFCGWICPTGTLQEWAGWVAKRLSHRRQSPAESPRTAAALTLWIFVVVAFLIVSYRVFSGRRPILEDSATLWAGSLAVLVAMVLMWPNHSIALKRFRAVSLILILGFTLAGVAVYSPVHFVFMNVADWASLLSALLIIGAGAFVARAWCRYLCPFGLVCGWAAKYAAFQIERNGRCTRCGVCSRVCEVEAVADGKVDVTSCIACMKCVDHCPDNALALVARPFGGRAAAEAQSGRVGAALIVSLLLAVSPPPARADVEVLWNGFRGGAQAAAWRQFDQSEATTQVPATWTFRGSTVAWNYAPGVSVWSSPAVAEIGGRVVCFVGSYDHNVYALDVATGAELWRFATGDGVFSTPAVFRAEGRDYVMAGSSDRTLYWLDAKTGAKVWAYEVYEWRQSLGRAFLGSPVVVSGSQEPVVILVSWVYDTAPKRQTETADVWAFPLAGGKPLWKRQFAESRPTHPVAGQVGGAPRIYVGCRDGNLYCLDAESGEALWRRTSKFPVDASPAFLDARGDKPALVLVGSKFGDMRALDAASGDRVWSFKTGHWVDATPALVTDEGGRELAVFGSYDGRLYCLDARTGDMVWRYNTRGNIIASAAMAPGEGGFDVFVPSDDDMLHAVDGRSGRAHWTVSPGPCLWSYSGLGDTIWASPVAVGLGDTKLLILPHYDGRVHAYRLDRSHEWLREVADPAYGRSMLGRIAASMAATLLLALAFVRLSNRGSATGNRQPATHRSSASILVFWLLATQTFGGARIDGSWIVVTGKGNTLESIARDVGQPSVFSFDPETGSAVSGRSLRVSGELTIGGEASSGSIYRYVNSLEFDVGQCGQARILLAPTEKEAPPLLSINNARIATAHTEKGNDACNAEGNILEAAGGRLVLRRSVVMGNLVVRIGRASAEIVDSAITTSNHAGLSIGAAPMPGSRFVGLRLLDHQLYGMEVGPLEKPLVLEDCTIRGGGADLHVRGRSEIIARDCDFDSVRFAGGGGSVRRQWTVTIHTGTPASRVVAESEKAAALKERVESVADSSGTARLVLTEYVAQPGGRDYLRAGQNDATPHRLTVLAPDGQKVLGALNNYRVLARGQEVRFP